MNKPWKTAKICLMVLTLGAGVIVAVTPGSTEVIRQWFSDDPNLAATYSQCKVVSTVWGTVGQGEGIYPLPYTDNYIPSLEQLEKYCLTATGKVVYPEGTPVPERRDLMLYSIDCSGRQLDAVSVKIQQLGEPVAGPAPGERTITLALESRVVGVMTRQWQNSEEKLLWESKAGGIVPIYLPTGARLDLNEPILK